MARIVVGCTYKLLTENERLRQKPLATLAAPIFRA